MFALALAAVLLHPCPQKFRTFYAPGDAAVPRAVISGEARKAKASDGAEWTAGDPGLWRIDARERQYFAGMRYLPDDDVRNIVPDSAGGVWVRTSTGVSHIELRPMTLRQKADYFERRIRERHDRYGLVASSRLREPGNLASNQLVPSDNDGLWTAMYASAECFRYAVTKSPEALANARKSIDAVLFLEQITGRPGFPARSYIRKGDYRGQDGTWHWTPDGQYEWKADTSSDEIVGHFFLFGVAWDLLPDPELKQRIAATAGRIMDHILDHGLYLTDINGKPTTWGKWSEEYFASRGGKPDAPLNAIEILSFLKTASHITGRARYEREYRRLAFDRKYLDIANRLLEWREEINYSDEELAMLPFYLLFQYEKDAAIRTRLRSAIDQWWQNIQREKNPLWNAIYRTAEGPADLDAAVWTLCRIPMDLVEWRVTNSGRKDVPMSPDRDRFQRAQALTLLPPDERPLMKWNGNPFRIDGGNGGAGEDDGAFFLLPYWMGEWHRLWTPDGR